MCNQIAVVQVSRLVIAIMLLIPTIAKAQESPSPYFGSGIVDMSINVSLSPQGNYVADTGGGYIQFGMSKEDMAELLESTREVGTISIRLWDTRLLPRDEIVVQPPPLASTSLDYRLAPDHISNVLLAFSPDERYLAVRKDYDLTILTRLYRI